MRNRSPPGPNVVDAVEHFDTQRLFAERLRATDYADLCRMNQNPRVMEAIGGVRSDDTTREYFGRTLNIGTTMVLVCGS